ncbi:MAG: BLUF domain-containing protein [Methylotenera sp.]|uniref:BLUF domain-containing protein n=1 Tax=Methylotenera sp. TaxID=2051956 RepID=UPI00248A8D68|nr:BLUF domain-containing protein [Methylotenera sp.]MDI1310088.1 BLUF domain-containing protein [Methylotenera sp.]
MTNLYSLLFTSKINPDFEINSILNTIKELRAHNNKNNITGLMVFDGCNFIHFLEGEKNKIFELLNLMKNDLKQLDLEIRIEGELSNKRLFPTWSVGYSYDDDGEFMEIILNLKSKNLFVELPKHAIKLDLEP